MEFKAIEGTSFGAEVHGINLSRDTSDKTIKFLLDALYEHRAIVIKNQSLSAEGYLAFGRKIGTPEAHPLEHLRLAGFPEIEAIGNTQERDRDPAIRNGAAFWHTDQCYEQNPASMIILYSIQVPHQGGETMIADMRTAYDDLDQGTKDRIDQLVVHHLYSAGGYGETKAPPIKTKNQEERLPPARHNLVLRHPVTERKSLYAVSGFATAIEGMLDDEAVDLLQNLTAHALRPQYQYTHRHAVGDITIIDLFQTLHSAVPIDLTTGNEDARLLWRLGIKNAPGIYANRWKLEQLTINPTKATQ
jgi:taurine dioxygenase